MKNFLALCLTIPILASGRVMMPSKACEIIKDSDDKMVLEYLMRNLAEEAQAMRSVTPVKEIHLKLINNQKHIVGGIYGYLFYGSLVIDMLWLDPYYRKKGYGKKLVMALENMAKAQGAKFSTVTTMDWWEALPFYHSLSYKLEFIREGYENGSKQYSLRKELD